MEESIHDHYVQNITLIAKGSQRLLLKASGFPAQSRSVLYFSGNPNDPKMKAAASNSSASERLVKKSSALPVTRNLQKV